MRLTFSIALAMLSTAALAVEVPLAGIYGNEAGCAVATQSTDIPDGNVNALALDRAYVDEAICPILSVSEPVAEGDVTTWQIDLSCETGHEEAQAGTLSVSENKVEQSLVVKVESGYGPKGNLKPCTVAP